MASAFACVLSLVTANPARSADAVPANLTVSQALDIALGGHARIQEAEKSYVVSQSRLRIAGITSSFSVGSEVSLERDRSTSLAPNTFHGNYAYESLFGTSARINVSPIAFGRSRGSMDLSLRHPLIKGRGALSDKGNAFLEAQSSLGIEAKQLFMTRQDIVQRVVSAYYKAVLAREQVKVQEQAVRIAEEVALSARKLVDAGYSAGIEASRAEIRVAQTKDRLNTQKQSAKGAIESLMLAIGVGVGQTPGLVDNVPDTPLATPTLEEALKKALANRPELFVADQQISNQQRALEIARDQLRPSLDAIASFRSSNANSGFISDANLIGRDVTAGVEYTVPLDKRIYIERSDNERRELESMRRLRTYQLESIAEEVGRAYRSVQTATNSLKIYADNRKVYEENYQLADRMLKEASGTNRDILDAQEALTQVEGSILQAKADLYLASIELQAAMGEDLTKIGIK